MNNSNRTHAESAGAGSCPYEDLYIYQLGGKLASHHEIPGSSFIGNWEEDDFSFLFFSYPAHEEIKDLLSAQPQLTLIDSYQMPWEQWQGAEFAAFDQGCFRVIPSWENGVSGRPDGMGYGLWWCDTFLKRWGGQIQLVPGTKKGCKFLVRLPAASVSVWESVNR